MGGNFHTGTDGPEIVEVIGGDKTSESSFSCNQAC